MEYILGIEVNETQFESMEFGEEEFSISDDDIMNFDTFTEEEEALIYEV